MNIYVGNLAKEATEQDLNTLFAQFGAVKSVKVIKDMFTGESKGFAFVEMQDNAEATTAMNEINTQDLKGKKLVVNEARPKSNDKRGGGNGGFNRGGGRSGGSNQRGGHGGGKRW